MSRFVRRSPLVTVLAVMGLGCSDAVPVDPTSPVVAPPTASAHLSDADLDGRLTQVLAAHVFTGLMDGEVERRLGRPIDADLARAGHLLFFDPVTSLSGDNTCAGCHAPNASFGGTQSIAIGVENNGLVGPDRAGPRNLRRSPTVANTALFPRIMLNSRFESLSGDPFDNSWGFDLSPAPEGTSLSYLPHLLAAQGFMPVVDRSEMAGFHFVGDRSEMREEIARRVDAIQEYRTLLAATFPDVADGGPITFDHIAGAYAEFQASLVFADAPIDAYARGQTSALTPEEKRGALLFFGKAGCVGCHAVDTRFASGDEMFTDYEHYVIGVPQIVPDVHNVEFDGPHGDEDFGREHVTGKKADRYAFRTSPLRNVALQPWFMHNGAFRTLEQAIEHHLDAYESARTFDPSGLDADLQRLGPIESVLRRLDRAIAAPPELAEDELRQLVAFVRCGLLDMDARPERLRRFVPSAVPSGQAVHVFQDRSTADLVSLCSRRR